VVACPCGRLEVDLFKIVGEIERAITHIQEPINVAVMGARQRPGERTAHVGVAAGGAMG
jgi:(E)-4-hydroxy-3-methylbut-2-enyl-diphosphate synthase